MSDTPLPVRLSIDAVAGSTIIATYLQWLPTAVGIVGGILSIIWFVLQITDHPTVRAWLERRRDRIHSRKLATLRAKQRIIEAKLIAAEKVRSARAQAADMIEQAKSTAAVMIVKDSPPT